jgi:hypothetical protein
MKLHFCAVCQTEIFEAQPVVQHEVYDVNGSVYVEVAHRECGDADNDVRERMGFDGAHWQTRPPLKSN